MEQIQGWKVKMTWSSYGGVDDAEDVDDDGDDDGDGDDLIQLWWCSLPASSHYPPHPPPQLPLKDIGDDDDDCDNRVDTHLELGW